jgi:8-oxo-dGTP pyrophosphatase MutT (NUDIX family)
VAPPSIVRRVAVRLLVVDPDERLLLQHCITPDTREEFWSTPGGAIAESETPEDAARRELYEEEGVQMAVRLDAPIWERLHVFTVGDGRVFHQHERYHVLRTAAFEPSPGQLSDFERRSIRQGAAL